MNNLYRQLPLVLSRNDGEKERHPSSHFAFIQIDIATAGDRNQREREENVEKTRDALTRRGYYEEEEQDQI